MELLDTIKYFAKFPPRSSVLKNFQDIDLPLPGYAELKQYFNELPEAGLIPELSEFIISTNEKALANRIQKVDGFFMLAEYNGISSSAPDQVRNRNTHFEWAISIATHYNSRSIDTMVEAIMMDKCLAIVKQLIDMIKADDKNTCAGRRMLDSSIRILPIEPTFLYQSYGWELSFKQNNNLL